MRPPHGSRTLWPAALLAGVALTQAAAGQEQPGPAPQPPADTTVTLPPPVLTLDQDRLFEQSAWGRAAIARAEAATLALATENRRIELALEKEERDLTDRRATLPAADFAVLAAEFDAKVEEIRAAQDAKSRAITRRLEDDKRRFFDAATPVLGQLLEESGAVAILADGSIVMSLTMLDITERAIERVDQQLPPEPEGTAPEAVDAKPQSEEAAPGP